MIEVEDFPCHDMTHPPESRAPFCTQRANPANRIRCPEEGDDMYFCDACFGAGNEILDKIMAHIEAGNADAEEVLERLQSYAPDTDRDKN